MANFNGYRNWNQWNVSLWINNDELLYRMARDHCELYVRDKAASYMLDTLIFAGITHTPDGAKYSKTAIKAAMAGME